MPPQLRLLVGAGFFGAFTTFSTFATETMALANEYGAGRMLLNLALNNGLCLLAAALGIWLGQRLAGGG